MEKPEEQSESEFSLDKVREEKRKARENEVGYKFGQSLGTRVRSTSAIMLPVQMAIAPVLVTMGGWWVDGKFGTSPLFTLVGLVFGLAVSVLTLVRYIKETSD